MASIHLKGDAWHCQFLFHGKRHTFTLGKVSQEEAENKASQVQYILMRLKKNLLLLPPSLDIVTFVSFDGKQPLSRLIAFSIHFSKVAGSDRKP